VGSNPTPSATTLFSIVRYRSKFLAKSAIYACSPVLGCSPVFSVIRGETVAFTVGSEDGFTGEEYGWKTEAARYSARR
jgi:hypothetical protein